MGLDIVELVMAVEDDFEIPLPNDWGEIRTVGDLHQVICHQLDQHRMRPLQTCPSIATFLETRNALLAMSPVARREVRPSSLLTEVISGRQRRQMWQQLQARTNISLPPLGLPDSLRTVVYVACVSVLLLLTLVAVRSAGVLLVGLVGTLLLPMLYFATRPLALAFPEGCQTVGDVVRHARQISRTENSQPTDPDVVWQRLVGIVSDQLDVPISDVTRQARFVEDLLCD